MVNPANPRQGVGRALVEHLMRRYSHRRFFLLSRTTSCHLRASATEQLSILVGGTVQGDYRSAMSFGSSRMS
ncbi:hypothetical protein GCM10010388_61710 [Streptomyces mauvecolor]